MFSEKQGNVLHGILLIVLFSFSAFYIAEFQFILKSASNLNGNLNCSKELEHYAS